MKINEKLYKKYGTNTVILPPPPEEEIDLEGVEKIPGDFALPMVDNEDLGDDWIIFDPADPNRAKLKERAQLEMDMDEKRRSGENIFPTNILPSKKNASSDEIIAFCDAFEKEADAIRPPALEDFVDVKIPASRPPPVIEDPDMEFLDALEAVGSKNREKLKKKKDEEAELLKEIEHNQTIHASSVDDIVKLSNRYYDLCRKF